MRLRKTNKAYGKKVVLILDPTDAGEFLNKPIVGEIEQVLELIDNPLVVKLDSPLPFSEDSVVEKVLVVGISMNPFNELFKTPQRPHGLPILVAIWRLKDKYALNRVIERKKPPPSYPPSESEFLGRGEIERLR